jgi:predicted nucleotidyltransferase
MAKVNLFPDFKELLGLLNSAGVRYLVLGGYAVNHYGYHRATDDLDIWIATDPANAEKVSLALQEFAGFPASRVKPSMFEQTGKVFIFGREPVRVDILTGPSAVDFETSYLSRNTVKWDGIEVPLISYEDLKKHKRGSGRAKDLADLENLPAVVKPRATGKRSGRRRKPRS